MKNLFRHVLAAAIFAAATASSAQSYPAKPLRLVVPFAAGGAIDSYARMLGQKLTEAWKQQVIVDNRPGAGATIGADNVAKSAADGYSFLITPHSFAVAPNIYRKLPYDPVRDFAPVTLLSASFLILTASQKLPVASLRELITIAKSKPGSINYGSTGIGTSTHLAAELLNIKTEIDMVHVPYKGDSPQVAALLAGEVQVGFGPLTGMIGHVKANRLRALGITAARRSASFPDMPTIAEAGIPGFELNTWTGILGPAGIPQDAAAKFQAEAVKILAMPDIRDRLAGWGEEPVGSNAQDFAARLKSDLALYGTIIKQARIPLQD